MLHWCAMHALCVWHYSPHQTLLCLLVGASTSKLLSPTVWSISCQDQPMHACICKINQSWLREPPACKYIYMLPVSFTWKHMHLHAPRFPGCTRQLSHENDACAYQLCLPIACHISFLFSCCSSACSFFSWVINRFRLISKAGNEYTCFFLSAWWDIPFIYMC